MLLIPKGIIILQHLHLSLANTFRVSSESPALGLGRQSIMVAGVSNATYVKTESPIIRVCSLAGVALSGEKKPQTIQDGGIP